MASSAYLKDALQLDAEKQNFAAFTKYLSAIGSLCGDLLKICHDGEVQLKLNDQADKKVKLIKECTGRLGDIYDEIKKRSSISLTSSEDTTPLVSYQTLHKTDPRVEAVEKNKVLFVKYQAKVDSGKYSDAQLTSLKLGLHRQMTENIALAKQECFKKSADREKCKQATLECLKKSKACAHLSEPAKAFISDVKAFETDCPELRLYSQYIFEKKESEPDLLQHYLHALNDYPDHPYMMKVKETRDLFLTDLSTKNKTDEAFLVPICEMADHILVQLSLQLCDCLRIEHTQMDFIKKQLISVFYSPIMPKIFDIYQTKNVDRIAKLKNVFDNPDVALQHGFSIDNLHLDSTDNAQLCQMIIHLKSSSSPNEMLAKMVNVCRKFSNLHISASADDIIASLINAIALSKSSEIIVCCSILEDFINSENLTGEDGYCLTSVQAAINYLLSVNSSENIYS